MKYILLLTIPLLLFSCKKEETPSQAVQYPQKYIMKEMQWGTTNFYEYNDDGSFNTIDKSGSFVRYDDEYETFIADQQPEVVPYDEVEFISDKELKMKFRFRDGVKDTTLFYVRSGDNLSVVFSGSPMKLFEMDDANNVMNHCLFVFWGTGGSGSDWQLFPVGLFPCDDEDESEVVPLVQNLTPIQLDSSAINFTNFRFELEE